MNDVLRVPANIEDPVVKRFMLAVSSRLQELSAIVEELAIVEEPVIVEAPVVVEDTTFFAFNVGVPYRDFNSNIWSTAKGHLVFTCLGSETTNPPVALISGSTYTFYVQAITTSTGVMQKVIVEDEGVSLRVFYRSGSTLAIAISSGWTQV